MNSPGWRLLFQDETNDFLVTKSTGKMIQTLGKCLNGRYTISVEEGVYLLENGRAEVEHHDFNVKLHEMGKYKYRFLNQIKVSLKNVLISSDLILIVHENSEATRISFNRF